ncbi:MAG: hypothetical protein FJY88_12180 [Candidatus Eisenbacteria bacterium]|nr:hypothetical protein [Candidatus Eisenbacteria bacterium]
MSRLILLFLSCATLLSLSLAPWPVQAAGCKDQDWCFEAEKLSFRIVDNEITIDILRQMETVQDVSLLINYLLEHPARLYVGWIRPTPDMHSVQVDWNVGLHLKNEETVWAEKWFVGQKFGPSIAYDPMSLKLFIPGAAETSRGGKSFIVVLAFPESAPSGLQWKQGQVESLSVQMPSQQASRIEPKVEGP